MESFYYDNQHLIDDMRASDLRNMLIQKLGVSSSLVSRIIDKKELVHLMKNVLLNRIEKQSNEQFQRHLYLTALVGVVILIVYLCRSLLKSVIYRIVNSLQSINYIAIKKVRLIGYNIRKREVIGALFLFISLLLECAMCYIQVCTILTWFISRDHPLRRYILPTISIPINSDKMLSATKQSSRGSLMLNQNDFNHGVSTSSSSGFSIDVGPMITIALMRWLINACDNYSASRIHHFVQARNEKAHFFAKHHVRKDSIMIEEIQCLSADTRSDGCNDEVDADDHVRDTSHMSSDNCNNNDDSDNCNNNDDVVEEDLHMDLIHEAIVRDDMSINTTGIIEAVD